MFELSAVQILIVLVVALLVFGPKRLPELGRQLGRGIRELRGHMSAMTEGLDEPAAEPARSQPARPAPAGAPATAATAVPDDEDELLDGVVVDGATPPGPPPARG